MSRLIKATQIALLAISVPSFLFCFALNIWFYSIGSLTPYSATGRTFPVQEHGTLYVTPVLGEASIVLFFVSFVCVAIAAALNFWRRDSD